jgi:hypothetical protein
VTPAELERTIERVRAILASGRWPAGLLLTERERRLLSIELDGLIDRRDRRGAWARVP